MINVIMSPEPVDLTPTLDQLKAAILADNAANLTATTNQAAALDTKLDSITTVNGNISTEVQAINSNTDTKIAEVQNAIAAKGVIKSIQRGEIKTHNDQTIVIAAIDPNKAFVNISVSGDTYYEGNYTIYRVGNATAFLFDGTTLKIKKFSDKASTLVRWEVIEYV